MDLSFTTRQTDLIRDIRSLLAERFDPTRWEEVVATAPGYDRGLWADLMTGGRVTIGFPEALGGGGGGVSDLAIVAEELGRGPVPSPMLNGVVLSGRALLAACPEEVRLAQLVSGRRRFVTCLPAEASDGRGHGRSLVASRSARGWLLAGVARFVPYAADADELLVVAATESGEHRLGTALIAVDIGTSGVSLQAVPTLGGDRQCHVVFDSVVVDRDRMIGPPRSDHPWLADVVDVARVVTAAHMVGAAAAALDHATSWAAERIQFGTPIGTFQAIQHRLADALVDVVTARDAVLDAAGSIDRGEEVTTAVAGAKAHCSDACRRVTATAHQVCGGEGIHADQPLHLWHRRVASLVPVLGTIRSHRQEVAAALFGP